VGPHDLLEVQVTGVCQVVVVGPEGSMFFWVGELEVVTPDVIDHAERGSGCADNEPLCWAHQWGIHWNLDGIPPWNTWCCKFFGRIKVSYQGSHCPHFFQVLLPYQAPRQPV